MDEDEITDEQEKQKQGIENKGKLKKQKQPPLPAVRF